MKNLLIMSMLGLSMASISFAGDRDLFELGVDTIGTFDDQNILEPSFMATQATIATAEVLAIKKLQGYVVSHSDNGLTRKSAKGIGGLFLAAAITVDLSARGVYIAGQKNPGLSPLLAYAEVVYDHKIQENEKIFNEGRKEKETESKEEKKNLYKSYAVNRD